MTALQTKSETDMYKAAYEREYLTTLKVLRAYPETKSEFKPVESSQSAREIAWTLCMIEGCVEPVLKDDALMTDMPKAPATWAEVMSALEDAHKRSTTRLTRLTDEDMDRSVRTMVGPKKEGDVRAGDMLWEMLHMSIHHRGQFSVYLRMSGSKVPSIYGPSADEPWD